MWRPAWCGSAFVVCLDDFGSVWAFGRNEYGQLGFNDNTKVSIPKKVPGLREIVAISCGYSHTICADDFGKVWSFGNNDKGQLGIGNHKRTNIPTIVERLPKTISYVSCGPYNSFCLEGNGDLWSFGDNVSGQLGPIEDINCTIFPQKTTLRDIRDISAGSNHTICINNKGHLVVFGSNEQGQLGLGDTPGPFRQPITLLEYQNIISIACGWNFTLLLQIDGSVISFGENNDGQLGHGDRVSLRMGKKIPGIPPIRTISATFYTSLCIDELNVLWVFGKYNTDKTGIPLGIYAGHCKPKQLSRVGKVVTISQGGQYFVAKTDQSKVWVFDNEAHYHVPCVDRHEHDTYLDEEFSNIVGIPKGNNRAKSARK